MQFYAEEMIPAGLGLQSIALAELKKTAKKGYFAPERKRPLPVLPTGIGVVSSAVGAAIRDISRLCKDAIGMPVIVSDFGSRRKGGETVAEGIRVLSER